jgi:hypothetical protein
MGFKCGTGLLAGPRGHIDNSGQCRRYYEELIGRNEVTATITSSIQKVQNVKASLISKKGVYHVVYEYWGLDYKYSGRIEHRL